jgi:hypothetical protein
MDMSEKINIAQLNQVYAEVKQQKKLYDSLKSNMLHAFD